MKINDPKVVARFWSKVDRRGSDECWPWIGTIVRSGHGQLWNGERLVAAHRFSLALSGTKVDGFLVCHRCNNPCCVNPRHLYPGTHQTNIDDAIAAGQKFGNPAPKGEDNYCAVLTVEQVREARALYVPRMPGRSMRALAKRFGVCPEAMRKVLARETWREV